MIRSLAAASFLLFVAVPIAASPSSAQAAGNDTSTLALTSGILAQTGGTQEEAYIFDVFTIPPLPGISVTLDGVTRTTNSQGTTTFTLRKVDGRFDEEAASRAIVGTQEVEIDDRTVARFARPVERSRKLTLMYSRYYKTAFDFKDANGRVIPNTDLDKTLIKSSTGEAREIDVNDENWLLGTRVSGSTKPVIKPVFWTILDVIVDDTSVAHRGQTKFFPEIEEQVSSQLLLFDVRFRSVDAFFGFSAGDRIKMGTPSGDTILLDLVDGEASIEQLPRGEYEVLIEGSGLRIGRPVTLTRNQDLRLLYYTRLDLALVTIFLVSFIVLPFVIGHRRRKKREEKLAGTVEGLAKLRVPQRRGFRLGSRRTDAVGGDSEGTTT